MADTIYLLSQSLDKKNTSIGRLLRMIFGVTTEKLEKAAGRKKAPSSKPPGHGRKSAADYTGAQKIQIRHDGLQSGDHCPG